MQAKKGDESDEEEEMVPPAVADVNDAFSIFKRAIFTREKPGYGLLSKIDSFSLAYSSSKKKQATIVIFHVPAKEIKPWNVYLYIRPVKNNVPCCLYLAVNLVSSLYCAPRFIVQLLLSSPAALLSVEHCILN